jgi:GNAT superfamily N-acetyltransferase
VKEPFRLDGKNPLSWALMPQLHQRAWAGAVEFGHTQDSGVTLIRQLSALVAGETDALAVWLILDRDDPQHVGTIVSHLIVQEDFYSGHKIGLVVQLVADPGALTPGLIRHVMTECRAWCRSRGYARLLAITKKAKVRAWKRRFGFTPFRLLIEHSLDEGDHAVAGAD